MKKFLKISGLILGVLLIVGLVGYVIVNEPLPETEDSKDAHHLALKMLSALDHKKFEQTDYIEWQFAGVHEYQWFKSENRVIVKWDEVEVNLYTKETSKSTAIEAGEQMKGDKRDQLIKKAIEFFNNDSFWLVAPYKVFDRGTARGIVKLDDGSEALMVTYTTGGSTPGDSYLWILDKDGMPKAFKMWVGVLPVGGLEASWDSWVTTDSGAKLPTKHDFAFLELSMGEVIAK